MKPAVSLWQIRESYYQGPGVYEIGSTPETKRKVDVDDRGLFKLEDEPNDIAFGVFARRAE